MNSGIYKASLKDSDLGFRYTFLKYAVSYVMKNEDLSGLEDFLRKKYKLNGTLDAWVSRCLKLEGTIRLLDEELRNIGVVNGMQQDFIAELLYKENFEKLPL